MLFEGLVRLNPDRSIIPAQAQSITISPDGTIYTFHMRGSLWSNGETVTSFDFEKSWKDILNPDFPSPNAHLLYPIKNAEAAKGGTAPLNTVGIQAPDASTLIITLERPTPYFLDLISFCTFYPVNQSTDEMSPHWAYQAGPDFVSNGPYTLHSWKHNDEIILIKNPTYRTTGKVIADSIHFSMISNETTALNLFENHELDMIGHPLSPLPVDALSDLNKKGLLKTQAMAGSTLIVFNANQVPFTNANIRKAFSYAINREEIVQNITQLGEQIATNAVPPILKKHNTSFFQDNDIAKAKELLALGLTELNMTPSDLTDLTYSYNSSEINRKLAQTIQQQWLKNLGIHVKLAAIEHKILINNLSKRSFTMAQTTWIAQYSDPLSILERFKFKSNIKNYSDWENPTYIQLLDQSTYETGNTRDLTLEKAEALFLNEMPIAPIFHWNFAYIVQPHLKGIGVASTGDIYFESLDVQR